MRLKIFPLFPVSISSKKPESEGGFSAAKKDSKRKREPSDGDDVEVKSPPPSPPEDDDDDGIQVPCFRKIHNLQRSWSDRLPGSCQSFHYLTYRCGNEVIRLNKSAS